MAGNDYTSLVGSRVSGVYENFDAAHKNQVAGLDSATNWTVPLVGFKIGKFGPFKDEKEILRQQNFAQTIRDCQDMYSKAMEAMSKCATG